MIFSIYNALFLSGLVVSIGLTIVSLVTPAWKRFQIAKYNSTGVSQSWWTDGTEFTYGLITGTCSSSGGYETCNNYLNNAPDWKKAALGCMVASLAFCALAFVWSCVACCMCCCKACLTPPLPLLAGLACIMDIIGVTVYGVKSGQPLGSIPLSVQSWQDLESKGDFGYSMWIGIAAICVLFLVTLIGVGLVKASKISPL